MLLPTTSMADWEANRDFLPISSRPETPESEPPVHQGGRCRTIVPRPLGRIWYSVPRGATLFWKYRNKSPLCVKGPGQIGIDGRLAGTGLLKIRQLGQQGPRTAHSLRHPACPGTGATWQIRWRSERAAKIPARAPTADQFLVGRSKAVTRSGFPARSKAYSSCKRTVKSCEPLVWRVRLPNLI